MKIKFLPLLFLSTFYNATLYSQDIKECLNSDYRYILQRAWDESNNLQLVEKSNQFLKEFIKHHPDCKEFADKEIEQNDHKKHAIRFINTNTYPFSFAFSNSMRNQKFFIEGIQIAIEDGMLEVKTILDKLIIKDGQIPIIIIIDIEDISLSTNEINLKREEYFAHIFKHLEGNFHYSTYNRTEVNEIFNGIPFDSKALEETNINKIYNKVMETDVWNKLYLVRLTVKSILKDKNIFSIDNPLSITNNQSFVSFDLFRVAKSGDFSQKVSTTLMTSADISGVKKDPYFEHSIPVLFIGSLIFLSIFLFSAYKNHLRLRNFFRLDDRKKRNYKSEQINDKNLLINYFRVIFSLTVFLFLFTSYFYPYNHLFEIILGEWLEVSSKSSQVVLLFVLSATVILYFFLSYILSNKFIESSFLLNEIYGLPFLYGMSGFGIVLSIIYKTYVYHNFYELFKFSNTNPLYHLSILFNSCIFIISFFITGLLVQEILKLISLRKKLLLQEDYYSKKKDQESSNYKKNNKGTSFDISGFDFNKLENNISKINYLIPLLLFSLVLSLLYIVFFLVKTMKSNSYDIVIIWISIYLYIPFITSLFLFFYSKLNNKNLNIDYDDTMYEERLKRIDSKEVFESFLSSDKVEYRFIIDDSAELPQVDDNFVFINGREKSGKKEIIKKFISILTENPELSEKRYKIKILNLNFSENLEQANELSKFIEVGKLKIPEIAVLHESRKIGNILQENSKNPLLKFLEDIPFIGKYINFLISSDRFVNQKDSEGPLIQDITKIYLDYIKSSLMDNNSEQRTLLIFENIHLCNSFSYNILLNILDDIYSSKEKKEKNKDLFVILTGDIKSKSREPSTINLVECSKEFKKNKIDLKFKGIEYYKFKIISRKGYKLNPFKDIMYNNYSFAKTILNEYFIEKIYYSLEEKDVVYLSDVNLTLRKLHKDKKLKYDTTIGKIIVTEIIESVNLPSEIISFKKNDFDLLTSEEKFLVLGTTHLHDWFTLEQIAYTIGITNFELEKLIYSITEKVPELYVFRKNKYLRINKKIREYFKLEIMSGYAKKNIGDLEKIIFAKNFIQNYFPTENEDINDLKKLSNFSFYFNNLNDILRLNSFYIREAYFNESDRIKVFSVLKRLDSIIKECDKETQNEFLYLISIHYAFIKILNNQSSFEILKSQEKLTDSSGIKYLSLVIIDYNFKVQLGQLKKRLFSNDKNSNNAEKIFKLKINEVKESLMFNFENLLIVSKKEERLIVKGWIFFLIPYFIKSFIKIEDIDYKLIYENLLIILKKHLPSISKNIDLILNNKFNNGVFISFQPIHEFCMGEIEKIITYHKETKYDPQEKYLLTDMGILTKELEHLIVRIENINLEIYLEDFNKVDMIKNDQVLKLKTEKKFLEIIQFSEKIKNNSGLAITKSLFSHFYFYNKDFKKALEYNKASHDKNASIKDYKGIEKSLRYRMNFIDQAIQENSTIPDLKSMFEKTEQELDLLKAQNPGL